MNLTPVTIPKFIKKLFPNLVWEFPSANNVIYLTFDDGPTPEITEWTLKILKQYNAKSTFFCIGKNVEDHPDIFNKIVSEGHAIGNHTYNHLKGWKTSSKNYLENIDKAQHTIESQIANCKSIIINHQSSIANRQSPIINLFRPPYGQIKPKQVKSISQLGYKIIMWTVLSIDWKNNVSGKQCLKNVINNTASGSIVVFHDSVKASKNMQYTLPKVLEYFSKKGYRFETIN